jgi:cytochrome b561
MVGVNEDPLGHPNAAPPLTSRASHNTHWFLGTLLFIIGIAAIVGVVVAAMSGQTTVALIIALFAGAFFSRVAC